MNEHAGFGCLLSVLIVVVFTLVFHEVERADPPTHRSGPGPPIVSHRVAPQQPAPPARAEVAAEISARTAQVAIVEPTPSTSTGPLIEAIDPPPPAVSLVASPSHKQLPGRPAGSSIQPVFTPTISDLAASAPTATPTPTRRIDPPAPRRQTPRSAVTTIEHGERLVDVAVRVYGSADAMPKLWRANRDRLPSIDSPVTEGWLLRTP